MADAEDVDPTLIEANGWCQSATCSFSAFAAQGIQPNPAISDPGAGALAILISHSCDIVHPGRKEPLVEWLLATPIANNKRDSTCLYGRNPRRLHFEQHDRWYQVLASERFLTSRKDLERLKAEPDLSLKEDLRLLTRWISRRYIRSAFPDSFNRRIDLESIRKILDEEHSLLRDLLIKVEPMEELAPEQTYQVWILALMNDEDYKNEERRKQCDKLLGQLETNLGRCTTISIECELDSRDRTPISILDNYQLWDFDYLSIRDAE